MISRRDVLFGAAALPPSLAAGSGYGPLLAGQVYVWTQQLRSKKRTLAEGLEEILAGMKQAGFRRLEVTSAFVEPDLVERTADLAKRNGLQVPVVYTGGPMHEAEAAARTMDAALQIAARATKLGARAMNFNAAPKPQKAPKSDAELDIQASAVNRLGTALKSRGIRLFLHQHDPEMQENAREWRHLLRHTDPAAAAFCVDLDWVFRGGQDPMVLLREAGTRVASLHIRSSRKRVWSEALGEGDIDYQAVAAHLRKMNYTGYLVVELAYETDTAITRPLVENLRISREFAERTFGVSAQGA